MSARDRLEAAYRLFLSLPFPEHANNERLFDWLMDLLEIDQYYAGLAQSALQGKCLQHELIELDSLNKRFAAINGEDLDEKDKKIYYECQSYLRALAKVREALMEFQAQRCDKQAPP